MIMFIMLFLCLWLWPGGPVADPLPSVPPETPAPAVVPEVRFPYYALPDKLTLCGEPVPLNEGVVREALDREFILVVWSRAQTTMWLKRAHRYFPELEKKLKARNLPQDLKYVTLVESDLRHRAQSHAGAMGPWQFMTSTAQRFRLQVNPEVDARFDFGQATDAALDYLRDLRRQLGSWALALAAYNCGEGRVKKEMDLQQVNNYYHLALPEETERYVYRIAAAKIVVESPRTYGFDLPAEALYEPLEYEEAEAVLTQEIMVRSLAAACGTYYKFFKEELNPWIKGASLPPGVYRFKIPKGSAARFAEAQRFGRLEPKIETPAPNKAKP
uniref:Lytic transglycosylase n=1 Tax=Desulfobacca acetoxidans TaxID=60893 RepID=A0A7C3ZC44_9BACT